MRRGLVLLLVFLTVSGMMLPTGLGQEENRPPNADAGPDKYAGVGDTVYLDGSRSSDPDGDDLNYSWDFDDSDGIQEDATGVLVSNVYYAVGEYRVTLSITDGNLSDTDTTMVYIEEDHENRAPEATITEPEDFSFHNNTVPVTFDGSESSDPDGDLLSYVWDFGDGTEGNGMVTTHLYEDPGIMNVTLTVSDGEYEGSSAVTIFIEGTVSGPGIPQPPPLPGNPRPTARANGPYVYYSMNEVMLDSSGSKGRSLQYCWDLDVTNGIQTQDCFSSEENIEQNWENGNWDVAMGAYPLIAYEEPGEYTITLIVRAGYGSSIPNVDGNFVYFYNFTTATAEIGPHETVKVDPGKNRDIEHGEGTNLIGRARIEPDYEDERFLSCEWDFDADGEADHNITFDESENLERVTCPAIHTFERNATTKNETVFTPVLTARAKGYMHLNPTGNSSSDFPTTEYMTSGSGSVNLTIPPPPNLTPVVDCGKDRTVFVGEEVDFRVIATDPDQDDIVGYEWDFDTDGQVDYSHPNSGNTSYTYKNTGEKTATCYVTDERDGVGTDTVNITVKRNTRPVAEILAPDEDEAGNQVQFDGSESYDYDGPDEIVSYSWDFDASDGVTVDDTGEFVTHVYPKGGSYTVTLIVKDVHGVESEPATHDIKIVQTYEVSLDTDQRTTQDVRPGSSTTFSMELKNMGNGEDCFDLERSGTKSTWAEISIEQACLKAQETRSFDLRVTVPASADADDTARLTIEAISQGSSSATDDLRIIVNAMQIHDVSVWMKEMRATIKQGKTQTKSMRINNLGNGESTFQLSADGPSSGWIRFKSSTVSLDAEDTKEVSVIISVPAGADTGEHPITLMVTSKDDPTVKDSLVFTVDVKEGEQTTGGLPGFGTAAMLMALLLTVALIGIRRRPTRG